MAFLFDKTLLGLTDFLPHFRGNRVLISVRKTAQVPGWNRSSGVKDFMKSIRFRFLVAALAVMLGAAIAKSQAADETAPPPSQEHAWGMHGHMMGFPFKQLDLTDAQRGQVKAVMQKEHSTMKPLFTQLHQMNQQLKQYSEGTYDEAKVQA